MIDCNYIYMMTCKKMPTIELPDLRKRIQPAQINIKDAVFQRNNVLLQQKRKQYREEISNFIKELSLDVLNMPLVAMIKFIEEDENQQNLKEVKEFLKDLYKEQAFDRMFKILKKTLQEEKIIIFQSQQILQYEKNVEDNITLAQISVFREKKWFELFTSLENVVKLDQIGYFFHSNNEYISNCYIQCTIWSLAQISQLFDISAKALKHLRRFYNNIRSFISINKMSKMGKLIAVLTLARYKARISKLKYRGMQVYKELYHTKHILVENYSKQKQLLTCNQLLLKKKFRFCEIAIFAREKFLPSYPRLHKKTILQYIQQLPYQTEQNNRKQIIKFLMMQFHMPINNIQDFLRNIRNSQQQKNHAYFQQDTKRDLHLLQKTLKYIFACKALPSQAFQSLNMQQNYNTKLDPQFCVSHCRTDVLACFSKASLAVFKQYILISAIQLSIEAIFQPILAISKFLISYYSFKGLNSEDEEFDDLTATLVIATQANKVVFYRVYREKLANDKYLIQLKIILKQQKIKLFQPIVLYERQITNPMKWHYLRKFID